MDNNFNSLRVLFLTRENYLYCRITVNRQRCNADFTIHEKIDPNQWDRKRQLLKGGGPEVVAQNMRLEKIRAQIRLFELDLSNKGKVVTADMLKKLFQGEIRLNYTFLDMANKFYQLNADQAGKDVALGTVKTYKSRLKNATAFLTYIRRETMLCEEFNQAIALHFVAWLKKYRKASQNHCVKNVLFVRQTIRYALQSQLLYTDPLIGFTIKKEKPKPIIYLTEEQLKKLESYPFVHEVLRRVRDIFVFCCHTGLSYVDVARFDASRDVKDGWIKMSRTKTDEAFLVPLSEKAKAILIAYPKGLPVTTNANINVHLKEIAAVVELPQNLTCHVSRKTFGMLMLNRGVSIENVSRMLGHSSISITEASYAKVTQNGLEKDLHLMFGQQTPAPSIRPAAFQGFRMVKPVATIELE